MRELLSDPEGFWRSQSGLKTIVLDEIQRLSDPAEILKIGTDHFPSLKIVATGSSTLSAKRKFRDTLTGRKVEIWLTPILVSELNEFAETNDLLNLQKRALHGGLPPMFLAHKLSDYDYLEWMDSYWEKDIQELFVVDKKTAFTTFVQLILRQSGELFQATSFDVKEDGIVLIVKIKDHSLST